MSQVQSLERAFILLKLIAVSPNGVTMTRLAQQAELPTSTVSRLLQTLERFGAVERVANREGFRIGPGIFALASQGSFSQYLISIARPHLGELAKSLGETVTLSLPDGNQTLCIDQILGQHHLQTQNWVDQSYPLHATSDGKICLAYWPGDRLDRYLKQALSQLTAATISVARVFSRNTKIIMTASPTPMTRSR